MFLIAIIFLAALHAEQDCPKLDSYYVIGNYKACSSYAEPVTSTRCKYVKAICSLALSDYDTAMYQFSLLSTSDVKGLSLSSMVETQFMSGDNIKARSFAQEVSSLLSKKMPYSYPYFVSELLLAKSYISAFDAGAAKKRLILAETAGMEPFLAESIE